MTECGQLRDRILAASKTRKAQLVLKAAKVLNVFTEELERVDVESVTVILWDWENTKGRESCSLTAW